MEHTPRPIDLFEWLPDDVKRDFVRRARVCYYAAGKIIYSQGDVGNHIFRMVTGCVNFSASRVNGRELIYLLGQPGDCFGIASMIDQEPRSHTAQAESDAEVQVLDRRGFKYLRSEYRTFDDALIRIAVRQLRTLSLITVDRQLSDLSETVVSQIVAIADSFGGRGSSETDVSIPVTQTKLALMVGSSREAVNKILQQLQAAGLIKVRYGHVDIPSLARMRTFRLKK
jgi:CRP/FNR family cyclic AMP-dependent transcriptional regulator